MIELLDSAFAEYDKIYNESKEKIRASYGDGDITLYEYEITIRMGIDNLEYVVYKISDKQTLIQVDEPYIKVHCPSN